VDPRAVEAGWLHRIRRIERVAAVDRVRGQDAAGDGCRCHAAQFVFELEPLRRIEMAQRQEDRFRIGERSGNVYGRDAFVPGAVGRILQRERQSDDVLVVLVHFEDGIGWGKKHPRAVGQYHGLQHIDGLGDVGHMHAFAMVVEDV
jgi:hypothetical protein